LGESTPGKSKQGEFETSIGQIPEVENNRLFEVDTWCLIYKFGYKILWGKEEVGTPQTPEVRSPKVDIDHWLRRRMWTVDLVPIKSAKVAKHQEVKPRVTVQGNMPRRR
jgi:hypothetical protein